jgi:hypothetical protein
MGQIGPMGRIARRPNSIANWWREMDEMSLCQKLTIARKNIRATDGKMAGE